MAEDLKDLVQLKRKVEQLKSDRDKATGALEQEMKKLKKEFDCDSLEEGETLLEKLTRKAEEAEEEFETAYTEFMAKWKEKL